MRKCIEDEPDAPPEPPPAAKKAMYEMLAPMGDTVNYSSHILLASYYPLTPTETPAQVYAEARQTLAHGMRISQQTIARLSGPKNVADSVFPPDSRPPVSLAAITSLAMPSMPSFASIRHSATRHPEPAGAWLPPPQTVQPASATMPAPQVMIEHQDTAPTPASANLVITQPQPAQPAVTTLPQAAMPAPQSSSAPPGRKNLVNIFQDAWKR